MDKSPIQDPNIDRLMVLNLNKAGGPTKPEDVGLGLKNETASQPENYNYISTLNAAFLERYKPPGEPWKSHGVYFFPGTCEEVMRKLYPLGLTEAQKKDPEIESLILEEVNKTLWK